MKIKKLAAILCVATTTFSTIPVDVFAAEIKTSVKQNTNQKNTTSTMSPFSLINSPYFSQYNAEFEVGASQIKEYGNNGGKYGSSVLSKAFDGDVNTHWETGKANSSTFINEMIVTFKETVTFNRVVYGARKDASNKGFATKYEIYASQTETGNDFSLVTKGEYTGSTSGLFEINIPNTSFKRLKFVFVEAKGNLPSASELRFYKEDGSSEKMNRLFTDNTNTVISDEFNSFEKLDALEKEIKSHPLTADFQIKINEARAILTNGQMTVPNASVKVFGHEQSAEFPAYNKQFGVPVKNFKNNSGNWASQVIGNAFDGNLDTYWETGKGNSESFKNEVTVEFEDVIELNRMIYAPRNDAKGFATQFEILASPTATGNDFVYVAKGGYEPETNKFVEVTFPKTKVKRLTFRFVNSTQNWATAKEFLFYKEDILTDKVSRLFVDGTFTTLSEEFNTLEKIDTLERELNTHPFRDSFQQQIQLAKDLLTTEENFQKRMFTPSQFGDMDKHSVENLLFTFSTNLLPTGIYGVPGEKITFFLEANGSTKLPSVAFTQHQGHYNNWIRTYQLSPGWNTIQVPEIYSDSWAVKPKKGGPIYLINPYTPEEQGKAPTIRIEGGTIFPLFQEGGNEEEFMTFLTKYKEELEQDDSKLDLFELNSSHIMLTGTTTGAYEAYINQQTKPSETVNGWNSTMNLVFKNYGLDNSSKLHETTNVREPIRLMQPHGAMYGAGNHIGVQNNVMSSMLDPDRVGGWGLIHEIGHTMDVNIREWTEVTNNMIAQDINTKNNGPAGDRVNYGGEVYPNVTPDAATEKGFNDFGYFGKLGLFWQLQLYNDKFWPELQRMYREEKPSVPNQEKKQDILVEYASKILNVNLAEYFDRYKFTFSDKTREKISAYPALTKKVWYLNGSVLNYKGNGLSKEIAPIISSMTTTDRTATLQLELDSSEKENLLGYEIKRDGKIIGFTAESTYTDSSLVAGQNHVYTVTPYGKDLSVGKEVTQALHAPTLSVEENVTLKLNQAFDPIAYAKAQTWDKKELTDAIKVTKNNVNPAKKGTYEVEYEIRIDDMVTTKTTKVTVVSDYTYASDITPTSSKVGWKSLVLDNSPNGTQISLNRQGILASYAKGLGAHASSEVIYDISGKGFDSFESYIGMDQAAGSTASSTFEIWVDGKKAYNSGMYTLNTVQRYVSVPVSGAKEIKLITTDGGNGNQSDHTVWADAKFTKNSSAPVLTIPKSSSTKLGLPVDFSKGFTAKDQEDGDLTSSVKVTGDVNFNKTGEYPITYSVTDSDGNTTKATRTIAVVDMNDATYLTNHDWKSAVTSYRTVQKDKSVNGDTLKLTGQDGKEVPYKRGIGAHATSTIIYDLSDKNYDYFTSYIGVDRIMYNRPGSITFQVWLDGEKAYDSGLMNSTDPQKFIELDINGVKELKLVVTDGGNGNGSDHATFGDAKLHFANKDGVAVNRSALDATISQAEKADKKMYTEVSYNALQETVKSVKSALSDGYNQKEVDESVAKLQQSLDSLELSEEVLNTIVTIEDESLKDDIKTALKITAENITIRDMRKLTSLTVESGNVRSLKGLEHAVNLESLNIDYNEVSDLSPLKNLKKLTSFSGLENFRMAPGTLLPKDNKFEIEDLVIDRNGERILPTEVVLSPRNNPIKLKIEDVFVDGKVVIDAALVQSSDSVEILYENKDKNFQMYAFYLLKK